MFFYSCHTNCASIFKNEIKEDTTAFTKVTFKEIDDRSTKLNELVISIKTYLDKELTSLNKLANINQEAVLRQYELLNKEIEINKKSLKKFTVVILIGATIAMLIFVFLL